MQTVQIKLSTLWVALLPTALLEDVRSIFSRGFNAAGSNEMQVSPQTYLGMALLMVRSRP